MKCVRATLLNTYIIGAYLTCSSLMMISVSYIAMFQIECNVTNQTLI